jgi:hypothetical protein
LRPKAIFEQMNQPNKFESAAKQHFQIYLIRV